MAVNVIKNEGYQLEELRDEVAKIRGLKYADITVSAEAGTWIAVDVRSLINILPSQVVAVESMDPNTATGPCFMLWKPSGWTNIHVLRINTNVTSLTIVNTADPSLHLRIWYI